MLAVKCPKAYPLRLLSRKWSFFILQALRKPKSFSVLQSDLHFITNRMLARELKVLVHEGIVSNDAAYALTPKGMSLLAVTDAAGAGGKEVANHMIATLCRNGRSKTLS
jgi:DNA-binding HxlR family transcriptional regulator